MGFLTEAFAFARLTCGRVDSSVEMTDADIRALILPTTVRHFSLLSPKRATYNLQLTPNVSLYDLPDPNIIRVVESSPVIDSPRYSILGPDFVTRNPFGIYDYSSLPIASYAREQSEDALPWSVEIVGDKLEIRPSPSMATAMVLRTANYWTFDSDAAYDSIPVMYREALQWLLTSKLAYTLHQERMKFSNMAVGSARLGLGENLLDLSGYAESMAKSIIQPAPALMQG